MKWFTKLSLKKFVNQSNKIIKINNINNVTNNNNQIITTNSSINCSIPIKIEQQQENICDEIDYNKPSSSYSNVLTVNDNNKKLIITKDSKSSDNIDCIGCVTTTPTELVKDRSDSERSLQEQARRLEEIISGNETIERQIIEPDDFFSDPDDVNLHKVLRDWIIIDDPINEYDSDSDIESSFEKIERPPSVISLNSYENDEYGLFYSCNLSIHDTPEASYCRTLEDDIQYGTRLDKYLYRSLLFQNIPEEDDIDEYLSINDNKFPNGRKLYKTKSEREAFARSLMGPLLKDNNLCPVFNSSFNKEPDKKSHDFSIQKYFGLNDDGDIIIHTDHIEEEEGFGFLSKDNNRKVQYGEEVNEKNGFKINWRWAFQQIVNFFCKDGHPRNKAPNSLPGESIGAYTLSLASDRTSTFSRNIENFISCTKDSREIAPQVVMRNMRQFMSGMKNYLVKHGEGDFQREVQRAREHLKSDEFLNLDTILESVMHRLVVLPLREHLYALFVDYYTRSGDIQLLVENVKYASGRNAIDFGIRSSVTPPPISSLRQISSILVRLQEAELPLEKLELLLTAVSSVYEATGCPRGQQLSADDFLPLLVLVVAKCGFIGAEIEAEFMWGLLQPSLLSGEAGYYLTALCSAVHVLKSFMSSENEGTGSLDMRSSFLPASSSVLRVIIPDECNGSLQTRTLPVRPHTTTREVCRTIAHKARITNPQDYGLFKLVDGEETLLMDNECPQDVRIAARGRHCILAYKRIDAKIAWPTLTPSSF